MIKVSIWTCVDAYFDRHKIVNGRLVPLAQLGMVPLVICSVLITYLGLELLNVPK